MTVRFGVLVLLLALIGIFGAARGAEELGGVSLVADIIPNIGSSDPFLMTPVGRNIFFIARTTVLGSELWRTYWDNTDQRFVVQLVKDIFEGTSSSHAFDFCALADTKLVFRATDGENGLELWVSEGTAESTMMIKDIVPGEGGSNPTGMFAINTTHVYFAATTEDEGTELWITDGTEEGTKLVKDINPGPASSTPSQFASIHGMLMFRAHTEDQGTELWASIDGTEENTFLVADINPGTGNSDPSAPIHIHIHDTSLVPEKKTGFVFVADDGVHGRELFRGWIDKDKTAELALISDINEGAASSSPELLVAMAGSAEILFTAVTNDYGRELWVTNGSSAGTLMLDDINHGPGSSFPVLLTKFNDIAYLRATSDTLGEELYSTDGTTVRLVLDLFPGERGSSPKYAVGLDNVIWFGATAEAGVGEELYVTRGTPGANALLVKDIWPGPSSSAPYELTIPRDRAHLMLFSAKNATTGRELFLLNTTAVDLSGLVESTAQSSSSSSSSFTSFLSATSSLSRDADSGADTVGPGPLCVLLGFAMFVAFWQQILF